MSTVSPKGAKKRKTRHSSSFLRMARPPHCTTQWSPAQGRLLSLADELLLNIIDQIDARETMCNLAATCLRFQGLVEPYIWRALLVLQGDHARRIAAALDSYHDRIDYVQEISIRYKDEFRDGIEELNHFLASMTKLRHLILETPCPNNSEWRQGMYFDGWSRIDYTNLLSAAVYPRLETPLALPMLQSLTLHAHNAGDRKFVMGRAAAMFKHPTLRSITLSCLNFDAEIGLDDVPETEHKSTLLQSLTLVECNVNVRFLDYVLCLPKALQELSISERLFTFEGCEPSFDSSTRTSSPLFLTALQRQADTLQKLVHIGGKVSRMTPRQTDPTGAAKLRSLMNLEHLEIGFESHLYYYLRQDGFPPALQSLTLADAAISINAGHDLESSSDIAFRSLASLVTQHLPPSLNPNFRLQLKYHDHAFFRLLAQTTASPSEQSHLLNSLFFDRPAVYEISRIMQSHHSHFCVTRELFPGGVSYIPPYMYGEELPVEELMYHSDRFWHFNGIDYQIIDDRELRDALKEKGALIMCIECRDNGLPECYNVGDGSRCVDCTRRMKRCGYERDESGEIISAV